MPIIRQRTYTTPDNRITIRYGGTSAQELLDRKTQQLADAGVEYTAVPDDLAEIAEEQQIRDDYVTAIARLQAIEDAPLNPQIRDIAKILRLLLKLLRRWYTS